MFYNKFFSFIRIPLGLPSTLLDDLQELNCTTQANPFGKQKIRILCTSFRTQWCFDAHNKYLIQKPKRTQQYTFQLFGILFTQIHVSLQLRLVFC